MLQAGLALEYAHSVLSQSEQDARPDHWTALQGSWYRADPWPDLSTCSGAEFHLDLVSGSRVL